MMLTSLPETLPPFEIATVLQRVKGNQALLHALILKFYWHYVDFFERINLLIENKNYAEVEHLLHTLTGTAMLLGLTELSALSKAVEYAVQTQNLAKIKLFMNALEVVLNSALYAAATLLPPQED
jgi:HPt (histidine-containing phosphotransfer) domain-containing protein